MKDLVPTEIVWMNTKYMGRPLAGKSPGSIPSEPLTSFQISRLPEGILSAHLLEQPSSIAPEVEHRLSRLLEWLEER